MSSIRTRSAWLAILLLPVVLRAQGDTSRTGNDIWRYVQLPEFSVGDDDFDLQSFMTQVINDTTFYHAFLNTRYHPHRVSSALVVRNKKERETASLYRRGHLVRDGRFAELVLDSAVEQGKLRAASGDMRYLTAEMYDDVFFPKGRYVASNRIADRTLELDRSSRFDRYKSELKKFMFNPGQEIASVPMVGDKLDLFDPALVPFYDYTLENDYLNSRSCWKFTAIAKDSVDGKRADEDETVIKRMTTWFDTGTMNVLARKYRIAHKSILLDFDISIEVDNALVGDEVVPTQVRYTGDWDIPFKQREIVYFRSDYSNWEIGP